MVGTRDAQRRQVGEAIEVPGSEGEDVICLQVPASAHVPTLSENPISAHKAAAQPVAEIIAMCAEY